jgi:glycosyltransferase involved in cell wall biosynthesis
VIPARNAERYIAAAIASVLNQSHAASRIVIVDDASSDRTADKAAAFGDRVRIVTGEGKGPGAARNLGVRHSDSELVAFLDADDVCRPDRLTRQMHALVANPDAAMVFCDADYTDASGQPTGALFTCPEYRREAFLGQLFERNRILTTSVVMVRRPAFDAVGGFDEHLSHAEDYDLWLRLAGSGVIEHVPQSLVAYRLHASNLSGNREAHRRHEVEILNTHAVRDIRAALLDTYGSLARADVALSCVLFRMERYIEGEILLRRVRPEESDRALRHFLLGNFAVKRHDVERAVAEYGRCLACEPTFAPAHNNLGVIAAERGRSEQSREHFITAADLRPEYADPRRNLDALQEGRGSDVRYTLAPLRAVLRPALHAMCSLTRRHRSTILSARSDA